VSNYATAIVLVADAILFLLCVVVWAQGSENTEKLDELADPKKREDDLV
jgi:hypothetical protein